MKKIFLCGCIFLWIGIFLPGKPLFLTSFAAEQGFDMEEVRSFLINPEVSQIEKKNTPPLITLANKEVKFTAGKDGKWFTEDDEVYQYYLAEYDKKGKMVKKKCFDPGEDKIPFTKDDQLKEYWVYEYNANSEPVKEIYYKAAGLGKFEEGYYGLYDLNSSGKKVREVRYKNKEIIRYITYEYGLQGSVVKDVEYTGNGPDGKWFTSDDEIEKYHKREYDSGGRLVRAMEYHVDKEGKGPDNIWFTADDVISSTRVFFYDKSGRAAKVCKYIGSGPDKIWFTDDDVLQYYTLRYFPDKK